MSYACSDLDLFASKVSPARRNMLYKQDFEQSKNRMLAFWEKEIIDRCCAAVVAPKDGYQPPPIPKDAQGLEDHYTNPETVCKRACYTFENSFYGGHALPVIMPFLGTAGHAAYFDIPYQFADDTIWFFPIIDDYTKNPLHFNSENPLFLKQQHLVLELTKLADGKFFVSVPDNCGSIDALCQLRDSEKLLMDLYENQEHVTESLQKILAALFQTNEIFFDLVQENNSDGTMHQWMHTYHPGRHMQLQADFSCMISPDMYEKFVLPELLASTEQLDASIYHLDGMEQVRHLDHILSVPKLSAIQWTAVAGQPPTSAFIDVFKKIQGAGKNLILFPHYNEVEFLMQQLSHKGLHLCVQGAPTQEIAEQILQNIEKWTK